MKGCGNKCIEGSNTFEVDRRDKPMEPWYRVATPRKEVREGHSFNPDEFAIHLYQIIAGTAPEDYRDPDKFFSRTCFTRAFREHAGIVLRRLYGETANTAHLNSAGSRAPRTPRGFGHTRTRVRPSGRRSANLQARPFLCALCASTVRRCMLVVRWEVDRFFKNAQAYIDYTDADLDQDIDTIMEAASQ